MTLVSYLKGVTALAFVVCPWAWAGRSVLRSAARSWPTTTRALGGSIVALAGLIVTAQLVGSFGQLRRLPLAIASVLGAGVVTAVAHKVGARSDSELAPRATASAKWNGGPLPAKLAVVAGCLAAAQWCIGTLHAFRNGIDDIDSQAYHLPHAARFVQDHGTTALHYATANAGTPYYPANCELLHAIGMVTMRSDLLSVALHLMVLPLGLLAAWCLGKRLGTGPISVIGFSALAVVPLLATRSAASAGNDYMTVALFLSAAAFALRVENDAHSGVAVALAGLAAGLSLGTKLTMVVPVAGLTLTVWWLTRRRRAHLAVYTMAVVLTGSYWYFRNLIHVGSPIPNLRLGIFPSPPMDLVDRLSPSVFSYLGKRDFWIHSGPEGLSRFFGFAWPLILLLFAYAVVAWLLALRDNATADRAVVFGLILTVAATVAAYVFTPTTGGDANGYPFLFVYNLRYALPGLVVAFVMLPGIPRLQRQQSLLAVGGLVFMAAAFASKPYLELRAVVVAVALAAVVVIAASLRRAVLRAVLGAALVVLIVVGFPLARRYERTRFTDTSSARNELFAWGRSAPPGARVALVGLPLQYSFFGPRFETRVDYVGDLRPNNEFTNYETCASWRTALRSGKYDFVVAEPPDRVNLPNAAGWTRALPGSRILLRNPAGEVLDIRRVTNWPAC